MEINRWSKDSLNKVKKYGFEGVLSSVREPWYKFLKLQGPRESSKGENIFQSEWDVAIILDACRYDLFESLSSDFEFLSEIQAKQSLASITPNWMERTFTNNIAPKLSDTTYICGNPYSDKYTPEGMFSDLYEPWRNNWSDENGTLPARSVTDFAIKISRQRTPKRLLVHYMQPHYPFIGGEKVGAGIDASSMGNSGMDVWTKLELGLVNKQSVWNSYRENLRYVLRDVELLLNNIDADNVVITSDHGNAIGEFGVYGHPGNISINPLRKVPWVRTSAEDKENYAPDPALDSNGPNHVEDRLRSLGYTA
jgi:hypothetical protein